MNFMLVACWPQASAPMPTGAAMPVLAGGPGAHLSAGVQRFTSPGREPPRHPGNSTSRMTSLLGVAKTIVEDGAARSGSRK
jgi:hypothetical protein